MIINTKKGRLEIKDVEIKCGIFQGETLSPLWFCLALYPLSAMLKNDTDGYVLKNKNGNLERITHLCYMDEIKLYAKTKYEMEGIMKKVEQFSKDIQMNFGMAKCRKPQWPTRK